MGKIIAAVVALLLIGGAVGGAVWYSTQLLAVSPGESKEIRVRIPQGSSVTQIAEQLKEAGLIKNQLAFRIYCQLNLKGESMRAGTYALSPAASVPTLVAKLQEGKSDEFNVTIPPGLRVDQIAKVLVASGFEASEVNQALAATYSSPLLRDKPASSNLEGYLYPETYRVTVDTTAQQLIERVLNEHYQLLKENGILDAFAREGLTIHQGLTLASIIQKEDSRADEQKQIAQVFLLRLKIGMQLGSDVTFMYAAHLLGVDPSPSIDSPYNTRLYKGIPPGPIGNFTLTSLQAIAQPAPGDYLYFVAGDDGTVHFSRSQAEHDASVRAYCKKLCFE